MVSEKSKAVLGYPYEGGLYYLFSRENSSGGPPIKGHPYYEALYGENPLAAKSNAVNLAVLFDEIIVPPADEYLPEHAKYLREHQYYHPDLRIRVPLEWGWVERAEEMARALIAYPSIANTVRALGVQSHEAYGAEFLVARTIWQLRLACENDAVFIGGASVTKLASEIWRMLGEEISEICQRGLEPRLITIGDQTLSITGLTWQCEDVDSLAGIRQSAEITEYARKFRHALYSAASAGDMHIEMTRLMREAMEFEAVANRAKGVFETTGITSTMVGAIPVAGTFAALTGLGSFLGYKREERNERSHQWYLLGSKIQEANLKKLLRTK